MPALSIETHHKNQLASDWMHRGIDLLNENLPGTLEKAIHCFDEAIALRRTLPLGDDHFFRYGLSAGWINRGDALARLNQSCSSAEAVKSYDEALMLLESLPLEANVLYPRRLAITWISRGMALHRQKVLNHSWEAMECFREAIYVLEHSSATGIIDRTALLAGAWTNLAAALMESLEEDIEGVQTSAHKALALVQTSERSDLVCAEISLKARNLLCRWAIKKMAHTKPSAVIGVAEITDVVDDAMALVRHWKFSGQTELTSLALETFRFGCRIYENIHPHFLAEFLTECLAGDLFGKMVPLDQMTIDSVQAAIWGVLTNLQVDGFRFVGRAEFQPFLSDIRELRKVEERLVQLPCSSQA